MRLSLRPRALGGPRGLRGKRKKGEGERRKERKGEKKEKRKEKREEERGRGRKKERKKEKKERKKRKKLTLSRGEGRWGPWYKIPH